MTQEQSSYNIHKRTRKLFTLWKQKGFAQCTQLWQETLGINRCVYTARALLYFVMNVLKPPPPPSHLQKCAKSDKST